ncbi:hypothetical protein H312_00976, partial [Anncaliia algerae PRA339]
MNKSYDIYSRKFKHQAKYLLKHESISIFKFCIEKFIQDVKEFESFWIDFKELYNAMAEYNEDDFEKFKKKYKSNFNIRIKTRSFIESLCKIRQRCYPGLVIINSFYYSYIIEQNKSTLSKEVRFYNACYFYNLFSSLETKLNGEILKKS